MTRGWSALGSFVFLVLAPGTVAGLVPFLISRWRLRPAPLGLEPAEREPGERVEQHRGLGTPAPLLPPTRLVVSGLYRHVRNPMYVAIVALVGGQALLLGDLRVAAWGSVLWVGFHLFAVGYEEPALRRRFGGSYETYRANVRRWIPRARPWRAEREGYRGDHVP